MSNRPRPSAPKLPAKLVVLLILFLQACACASVVRAGECGEGGDQVVVGIPSTDDLGGLALRDAPSSRANRSAIIPANGTGISVQDCLASGWCKVTFRCVKGWAFAAQYLAPRSTRLVKVANVEPSDPDGLNFRAGPGPQFRRMGSFPFNMSNMVMHSCEANPVDGTTWCLVSAGAFSGWVADRFLAPDVPNVSPQRPAVPAAPPTVASLAGGASTSSPSVGASLSPALSNRPQRTQSDVRVALVIGNSAYSGTTRLANPTRDAKAVAAALRKAGFADVTEAFDLSRTTMLDALNDFSAKAAQADWALVYYAGHGMEVRGSNYLIPVDARLLSEAQVADEAIPLDRVLQGIAPARKLRLVVLDACRDNPFASRMASGTRSLTRGLAPVEPGGSNYIIYAAKHGQVAQDGDGANSPFVTALVKHMATPRLELDRMFRRVSAEVLKTTDNRQEPFAYGRLPDEDLFFTLQ